MKKITFIAFSLLILTAVGCRQQDEAFDAQDEQGLRALEKSRKTADPQKNAENGYVSFEQSRLNDGDPAPPPKK